MEKLDTLLNTLIKMGWKPWGREGITEVILFDNTLDFYNQDGCQFWRTLRELVSIESGLWQFVAEKELMPYKTSDHIIKRYVNEVVERESGDILEADVVSSDLYYEYRLLESALVPEGELGQFLLENIKVEGK